ncbi:CbiX/SirB N-terminal domain-containing protein [Bremerella cremea]|uniref:CbiX/SirB N-terminal domain-containing protein n=1 Tax=Bremerella cremea TaxID=1031537 RepID=UPI0031EC89E1
MQQTTSGSDKLGIIIVDHGSRRAESNELLLQVAELFRRSSGYAIVEPAHMELAEPSIAAAFQKCVEQGAETIVVHPYFLSPGRHWHEDIPRLAQEAAQNYPGLKHLVTAPLGLHPLMAEVMQQRIATCLAHCEQDAPRCDVCTPESSCQFRQA